MTHARSARIRGSLLLVAILGAMLPARADDSGTAAECTSVSLGEAIFLHNWARPEEWTRSESLGKRGDGLGPVFNDVSCVACHSMGRAGGAGGNEHNADILSVDFSQASTPAERVGLLRRARAIHPLLTAETPTVMLHHYGFCRGDDTETYDSWRLRFLEQIAADDLLAGARPTIGIDGVTFRLAQRNTPALWGAGLIERLRHGSGDRIRKTLVLEQNGSSTGVTGRLPRTPDGSPAWFGWRGHVEHLPEFVMGACANELGLAVSNHPQPEMPINRPRRAASSRVLDLTNSQVVALTQYVASLPRPEQVFPADPDELADVYAGERIFESAGCAQCHVPQLGSVPAIFSDLLLHDMGSSLSDAAAAFPEQVPTTRTRKSGGYYGGSSSELAKFPDSTRNSRVAQEWRTPPLWGVADSGPYLHDGRAQTLDTAIRLHGGEADPAADKYRYLAEAQQLQLLAFLGTLRAPLSGVVAADGTQ